MYNNSIRVLIFYVQTIRKLFIDAAVISGTNPAVILIKEMIEKGEISDDKAVWIIPSLTYHVKTPTNELLSQLVVSC